MAIACYDAVDMTLFASAARHRRAALLGNDGAAEAEDAAAWFARHDVVAPARMIAMLTPGFGPPRPALASGRSR
jgi:hypothetical protein